MTFMLQWGHGFSAVETDPACTPVSPCRCSFNGATAFQPWKPGQALRDGSG